MYSKKGIGFFSLIGVFVLVLAFIYIISIVNPIENVKDKIDFGNTIKEVDLINSKIAAETFFKRENVNISIELSKADFSKTLGLSREDYLKRTESSPSELLGCKLGTLELWYNEKNIAENEKQKLQESAGIQKYSNCQPDFNINFKTKFETFLSEKVKTDLSQGLQAQANDYEPIIELKYDEEANLVNGVIKTKYHTESGIARVTKRLDTDFSYDLGSYPKLLTTLSEITPQISANLKDSVPICMKTSQKKDELYCINESIRNMIGKKNSEILIDYDFNITLIEELESEEFYGLKFEVIKKATNQKELVFGVILKDTIPYTLVSFNLQNFLGIDNVINLVIDEPKFSSKVSSYVILYSYENFFDKNSANYAILLKSLQESKIPNNFIKTGIIDSDSNQYFHSEENQKLKLNLILSKGSGFEENPLDKKKTKQIKLFQIYDFESGEYKLLENRPLYVFVFATDKNFNYYVEEIEGKTKAIQSGSEFGPDPIPINDINKAAGELMNYQNSLYFMIKNYQDLSFDHFDLYLLDEGGSISSKCSEDEIGKCHYLDGSSKLRTPGNLTYIISSDSSSQKGNFDGVIQANEFKNSFELQNGAYYSLYVIPVDKEGKGVINKFSLQYKFQQAKSGDNIYYQLRKSDEANWKIPFSVSKIKITDKKAPDVMSSISVTGLELKDDGNLYLQWTKIDPEVEKLKIKFTAYSGTEIYQIEDDYMVGIDGKLIRPTGNIDKVEVSNILPIDKAGNVDILYSGQTHAALYTK